MNRDKEAELQHVNPNCPNPLFCSPHGEIGEVSIDIKKFNKWLTQAKAEAVLEERQRLANQYPFGICIKCGFLPKNEAEATRHNCQLKSKNGEEL